MKQTLQLRIGQQLAMTPQLQQAIKLLQMSTLDLQQEIQQALDSNVMLEAAEDEDRGYDIHELSNAKSGDSELVTSEGSQTDIPEEFPLDTSWDELYDISLPGSGQEDALEFETPRSKTQNLTDHLHWQLELAPFSERDHAIAATIIDAVNDDGYLTASPKEIFETLQEQLEDLEYEEVLAVLHRVQNFDPPGVAALDLANCLHLQLLQLPESTPLRAAALELVNGHLDLLATQERGKLCRKLDVSDKQLKDIIALIRSLDPKPGRKLQSVDSDYVVPDVIVRRIGGKWHVSLNPDIAPKLRINPYYSGMIKRADNSKDNVCLKDHLQEARWFIKSLHSRNDTLLRVARCIVEKQTGFLEHGPIAMKAMVLRDIADELELHESTISRVTTQKYMRTPNGIFEFKYFFSSHVATNGGGECSATAIRAFIKELIGHENPTKPLSDDKISELLGEKGIQVARRTIAKYREAMSIPSSSQRKRIL